MINEERSYTEYDVEVPTTDFPIGFDILDDGIDVVAVTLNDVDPTTLGYTVIQVNNTTYRFAPAVPSGVVRLTRITDIDNMAHVFTEGAIFISENMDGNFKQIRHAQQEVRDNFAKLRVDTDAILVDLNEVRDDAQAATQAANDAAFTANEAAAAVNDKVSYSDLGNAVDIAVAPIKDYVALPYAPLKSYKLHERVQLINGDIVKSTIANNIVNPNVNMTGWFNESKSQLDTVLKAHRDNQTIYDYGAVGDGTLHTVEEWYTPAHQNYRGYVNLTAVQVDYPFVTDKDFSCDQAAILKLIYIISGSGGGVLNLSKGNFVVKPVNNSGCITINTRGIFLVGEKNATIMKSITDAADLPNESVSWDTIVFTGLNVTDGGVLDITFEHVGGRRNNTATVSVRNGAKLIDIKGNNFKNSIGSCMVIEGAVSNPIYTGCTIKGNTTRPSARHSLYLSGATGNVATENNFYISALEAVQNRNPSDNKLFNNKFYGVSGIEKAAIMFTQPQDTTTSYKVINYTIENNKFYDLRAAAISSGVGVINEYASIKDNIAYLSDDSGTTEHGFQLFRFNNSEIIGNYIEGGRNRGVVLYGCTNSSLSKNNVKNTMSNTATGGVIQLQTHTDSIDGTVTNSTGNKIIGGSVVDDRGIVKHVNAVNFLTGNNGNTTTKIKATGLTTSTVISSVDGLGKNNAGEVFSNIIFTKSAFGLGTQAATPMLNGSAQGHAVIKDGFVQSLRFDVTQVVTSGTIRCRVFKNGATLNNILFTANNSLRFFETYFQPNFLSVARGDILTATIESDSTTSGQASFDVNFSVRIAE